MDRSSNYCKDSKIEGKGLVTTQVIKPGEEITIDYAYGMTKKDIKATLFPYIERKASKIG